MSRIIKAACCVLVFVLVATMSLPFRALNTLAAEGNYKNVSFTDGTITENFTTAAGNVLAFLEENEIELKAKDQCSALMTDEITEGMAITVVRGVTVTASVNGIMEKRRVSPGSTAEQLQLVLQSEYGEALHFNGDAAQVIREDDILTFSTWQDETVTHIEEIPFETHEMETTAVREGMSHVRQEGVPGQREITTSVVDIGGKEDRRTVVGEVLLSEPVPQIIDVGIGGRLGTLTDTSAEDFHYLEKLTMNASAYTAGYESTGKNPGDAGYGRTAMGLNVEPGIVSVDPNVIPLGTRLYVEGYGFSLAADTGSEIKGHKIDLFMEFYDDAIQFGRRDLDVYILE